MMFPLHNMNPRTTQKWRPVIESLENVEKQKFNHTEFADFLETCANLFVNDGAYVNPLAIDHMHITLDVYSRLIQNKVPVYAKIYSKYTFTDIAVIDREFEQMAEKYKGVPYSEKNVMVNPNLGIIEIEKISQDFINNFRINIRKNKIKQLNKKIMKRIADLKEDVQFKEMYDKMLPYQNTLVLNYFEVWRLLDVTSDDEDFYWELLNLKGDKQYLSCCVGFTPLKGKIDEKEYERLEYTWTLNEKKV